MRQYRRQERHHPILSPVAIMSTLALIGLLSLSLFRSGGQLFSPGNLSAVNQGGQTIGEVMAHAEVNDCSACHTPFQGVSAAGCESCHDNIAAERQNETGLHGRFAPAEQCEACHTEHKGADFTQIVTVQANFNHEATRFSLREHGRDYQRKITRCADCHQPPDFTAADAACTDCHHDADPEFTTGHQQDFGEACTDCHDGLDTMAEFTLAQHEAAFPLTGEHAKTSCAGCHQNGRFENTPSECAGCHEEPAVHAGLFTGDCADCHTETGWQPAQFDGQPFDHSQTRFTLASHAANYDGSPLACLGCHQDGISLTGGRSNFAQTICTECHQAADPAFMNDHTASFGKDCLACHDGSGEMADFDHSQIWPLNGQHAVTVCSACHVDRVFAGTASECAACHAEPEIHLGLFGAECASCHTETAWQPARLTRHNFPLNHGRASDSDCATCHLAAYTEYTCYECHEHDPSNIEREHREEGIRQPELAGCARCHPTGRENEAEGD